MSRFQVKKVAVLGAGVMGAQIAAHLVNVKVPVVLFDLPAKEGPKNGIVTKAVEGLKKLKPSPLGVADDAALIQQANYEEHMHLLKECDLVIEAIAERMDWKLDLYTKIAPHVAKHAILASNTSGLSITKLSEVLPESIKPRFCGIHFFNPPRYMTLVELINTPTTQPPTTPTALNTAAKRGMVRTPATKRGARMRRKGSTAIRSMALSCSPAFMRPISAVSEVPARPANSKAVTTGPSSRTRLRATSNPSAEDEP